MDSINSFIKRNKTFLILLVIIIIFYTFIQRKFSEIIISNILTKIDASIFIDIISIVGIIVVLTAFIWPKIKNNYYISFDYFFKSCIILSFLIYIRFQYFDELLKFSEIPFLTYYDVLLFIAAIPSVLFTLFQIRRCFRKHQNDKKDIFLDDVAIKKINQDVLALNSSVESLKSKIISIYSSESVAIGIIGKWGDGKTSFMNLLKEKFKKDNLNNDILIDFNPWLNINTEHIAQEFFNTIENKINDYSLNSSKEFREYASYITDIDNTGLINKALKLFDFNNSLTIEDKFDKINHSLKKINKKVIVFIDDIDRLQANEILDILKLIRNTANFHNFIYIVAYDKEYVLDSLKNLNIPNYKKYIDKIFIEEIKLLPISSNQSKILFLKYFESVIPTKIKEVDELINRGFNGRDLEIHNILRNIRDIKRFVNSFNLNFNKLKDNILFADYFVLQLIKFKYYNVYLILFNRNYLRLSQVFHGLSFDENFSTLIPNQSNSNDVPFRDSLLKDLIVDLDYYAQDDLIIIEKLIDSIFPEYGYRRSSLAINRSHNFYKYFREEINEGEIPYNDFLLFTQSTYDDMIKSADKYQSSGKLNSLVFHLVNTDYYKLQNRNEYEKLLSICFYVNEINTSFFGQISYETLWYNSVGKIKEFAKIYFNDSIDDLKEFTLELLHKSKLNDSIIGYCKMVDNNMDESEYYKKEEFYDVIINHFEFYCNTNDRVNNDFWSLFRKCNFTKWENKNNGYKEEINFIHPRAINLFKKFMKRDLDNILVYFLQPQSFYYKSNNQNKIFISGEIPNIFGSYNNLKSLLESKAFIKSIENESLFRKDFIKIMNQFGDLDSDSQVGITDQQLNSTFPPLIEKLEKSKYSE